MRSDVAREKSSERRAALIADGRCASCGANRNNDKTMCQVCLDKRNEKNKAAYREMVSAGCCWFCGAESNGKSLCQKHLDEQASRRRKIEESLTDKYGARYVDGRRGIKGKRA